MKLLTTRFFPASFLFFLWIFVTVSCSSESGGVSTDATSIESGKALFAQHCTACHNFVRDGIGPHLGGLTEQVGADWVKAFVKDPQAVINSGDERGKMLFDKYKTYMPGYSYLNDDQIDDIIAYINVQEAPPTISAAIGEMPLENPLPDTLPMSDLVVELEQLSVIPPSSESMPRTRIVKMDFIPGTQRLFIADLRGKMYELVNNQPRLYLDMAALLPQFVPQPGLATGFGSFAFHPEFVKNGLFYTGHTEPAGTAKADFAYADSIPVQLQWVLMEWQTNDTGNGTFKPAKSRELFRINVVTGIHGMQEITFNPLARPGSEDHGLLYIGIGDGGAAENGYTFLIDNLTTAWGAIFRIDPAGSNSRNGKYGIPASNPFASRQDPAILKEIYAKGFRNPHRITWTQSGLMLASNIGQKNIESLYMIYPGLDYGWPYREGAFIIRPEGDMDVVYDLKASESVNPLTYPVAQYDHDEGNAISGGFEYWGNEVPQLKGKYLFGDIVHGTLFYVEVADMKAGQQAKISKWQVSVNGKPISLIELCGSKRVDLRFGRDYKGDMYIFTKSDGKIYKMAKTLSL